ncbi:MAG: aminoacyl--tRNA ligase-related protein, partial [bacterium]|nr:aminoacyl--tRNA ligase-related protein [bacterium]
IKFRDEERAKSGILRGREFLMKDMYSFAESVEQHQEFYEKVIPAYFQIFKRLGLDAKLVEASGGIFSKYSHEFQVLTEVGEDTIFTCEKCDFAQNKEIAEVKAGDKCPKCEGAIKMDKGIEVGNIFSLKDRFSKPMKATFSDKAGKEREFIMGCYGIGITRAMATVVEKYYDVTKNKMAWPVEITPYKVHLISLNQNAEADKLYDKLRKDKIEVLYDDRDLSAGEKFAEADLIGCPKRIIVSKKTLEENSVELQTREKTELVKIDQIEDRIKV